MSIDSIPQVSTHVESADVAKRDVAIIAKIKGILAPIARSKERSYKTSTESHLPALEAISNPLIEATDASTASSPTTDKPENLASLIQSSLVLSRSNPPPSDVNVVLFGDGMLERMATSMPGQARPCLGNWPSSRLMNYETLKTVMKSHRPNRIRRVLNLGVGGEKIQNVAYRMVGQDKLPAATANSPVNLALEGYLPHLVKMRTVKLWVVQAGTNNLNRRVGLSDSDLENLSKLLKSLLLIPSNIFQDTKARILLTGFFYRSEIPAEFVDAANAKLEALADTLSRDPEVAKDSILKEVDGNKVKVARVVFLPANKKISVDDKYFVDHVNLNLDGYREWMKELVPWVYGMLEGNMD